MIEQNHEYYVSSEVAKLLKQAGFDWEVNTCRYNSSPDKVSSNGTLTSNFNGYAFQHIAISTPTLEVAQRWFREVKNIQIIVSPLAGNKKWTSLICKDFWLLHEDLDGIALTSENFDIYELALESGIKKALEIILEKGE